MTCTSKGSRICINWNPPFQTQIYLVKVPINVNIVKQDLHHKKQFLKSEVWKGGFQLKLILGLLGMYFDAAVVFVTNSQIFLRLAVAIQWLPCILTIELHFQIPFGNTATIAAITTPSTTATNIHRFCGRYFSTISDDENSLTVCSKCLSYQYF